MHDHQEGSHGPTCCGVSSRKGKTKLGTLWYELLAHLPYTIFSVAAGLIILGFLTFGASLVGQAENKEAFSELFHIFHPIHLLLSAVATTAMFYRHEPSWIKAAIVGSVGAVVVCSLSDILVPYAAGYLLGADMHFHLCILEHESSHFFIIVGVIVGLAMPRSSHSSTLLSHSYHVFVSSMASILYLVGYGLNDWTHVIGAIFIYMVVAVILPCCTSDIALPLLLVKKRRY